MLTFSSDKKKFKKINNEKNIGDQYQLRADHKTADHKTAKKTL